jgi:LysR family transcriptional regulator, hca operon transcriptional activator
VELRHLRYFVAVAEELNFTRAAARLHTAQPSLSQQIRQLEAEVGARLLERTPHHVRLTVPGRMFLRDAREILARLDHAVRMAASAGTGTAGEIAIGTFPAADVKIVPALRPLLAEQAPDLRYVLHSRYALEPLAGLRQGKLDIAFLRGPVHEPDLLVTELIREPIMVVLPAHHRLARRRRIALRLLQDLPHIATARTASQAMHDAVAALAQAADVRMHAIRDADNSLGHLQMVQEGLGFALLPDYVGAILPPGVVMRPLDWDPAPTVSIVMAQRDDESVASLRLFTSLVRVACQRAARRGNLNHGRER